MDEMYFGEISRAVERVLRALMSSRGEPAKISTVKMKLGKSVFFRKVATSEFHVFDSWLEFDAVASVLDVTFMRFFVICERELVIFSRHWSCGRFVNVDRALALT